MYAVGALLSSPAWGYQLLSTGKWRTDWRGRFGHTRIEKPREGTQTLLIHAVSVGEANLVRRLVEHLETTEPKLRVVISTTTNTGFARATNLYGPHRVVRFPFDFSQPVTRFLDTIKPDAVALTELEVWPNFMQACAKRGIPVAVINGRLSERSFNGYRKLRPLLRKMFASLSAVAAQTQDYADRFTAMGVPADKVHVLDTMKWDTAEVTDHVQGSDELAQQLGIDRNRPLVVAGSTGVDEEKQLIEACPEEAQLMLVPRKPERFNEVASLSPNLVRRSDPKPPQDGSLPRLFLLDTMGELGKAYALADIAVVGRSFNGWGGSDPIEPVALGRPTVIGKDYHNFIEVVEALHSAGGLVVTDDPGKAIAKLLRHTANRKRLAKRGREVILSRKGSTQKHADLLLKLLANHQDKP